MKKKVLSLSIAAMIGGLGLAGGASAAIYSPTVETGNPATALVPSASGKGHILMVPYFTTQNGNATLFSITNTDTVNGKLVKVRFRGAANSDDILDFQVFLSPNDVWTANVSQGAGGVSTITASDKSCTIPQLVSGQPQAFKTDRLNPALTGDALAAQTREGYIEILNMADVPQNYLSDVATSANAGKPNALYQAILHSNGVAPCTPAAFSAMQKDPKTVGAAHDLGLAAPSGQLFANWIIMNQNTTTSFGGEAAAVVAASGTAPNFVSGLGNLVFFPQMPTQVTSPGAGGVTTGTAPIYGDTGTLAIEDVTADPLMRFNSIVNGANLTKAVLTPSYYEFPDLSTPYVGKVVHDATFTDASNALKQAADLTATIARSSVVNEFYSDPVVAGKTDMLFSMPTRRYHVALDYTKSAADNGRVFTTYDGTNGALDPATATPYFGSGNTTVLNNQVCVVLGGVTQYDREEGTAASSGFAFSPGTAPAVANLCGEVSVVSINASGAPTGVLGASVTGSSLTLTVGNAGWLNFTMSSAATGKGLPVLGSTFMTFFNPGAGAGVAATYGVRYNHRYTNVGNGSSVLPF